MRRYGKSKQQPAASALWYGLFMDYDGVPAAFLRFIPEIRTNSPPLKPLEKKVSRDYGLDQIIVCTDGRGLSSKANRKVSMILP